VVTVLWQWGAADVGGVLAWQLGAGVGVLAAWAGVVGWAAGTA